MILANRIPRLRISGTVEGFDIVPAKFIVPHFDAIPTIFRPLALALMGQLKGEERMIGVDEDTALVGKLGGEWQVMGRSKAHVFTREGEQVYKNGQTITLD